MELAQREKPLWKSLSKSLAEPSGRLQEKDSPPFFGFDPQVDEEWKGSAPSLWIAGMAEANPQPSVGAPESSCLQNRVEAINPGFGCPTTFIRLSFNKTL